MWAAGHDSCSILKKWKRIYFDRVRQLLLSDFSGCQRSMFWNHVSIASVGRPSVERWIRFYFCNFAKNRCPLNSRCLQICYVSSTQWAPLLCWWVILGWGDLIWHASVCGNGWNLILMIWRNVIFFGDICGIIHVYKKNLSQFVIKSTVLRWFTL